jgi:hypothetical protein
MKTAVEPNGHFARNPVKELDENQGELVARPDRATALGAGTPLGRGQAETHTSARRPMTPPSVLVWETVSAPPPKRAMHLGRVRALASKRSRGRLSDDG